MKQQTKYNLYAIALIMLIAGAAGYTGNEERVKPPEISIDEREQVMLRVCFLNGVMIRPVTEDCAAFKRYLMAKMDKNEIEGVK